MDTQVRVAVVGAGHLGQIHARIYAQCPDARLIGICDTAPDRAAQHAAASGAAAFTDYRSLFGAVDAVSIATPTSSHYAIARDFLKNGVHLLIEKPITLTAPQANSLINLAEKKRLILQVGHVERFNPAVRQIQQLCHAPRFIECHRLSPFPKRGTDVNVVFDLMIHDIDIVLSLVKAPLSRCEAIGLPVISPFEDIANARLTFKNGTVCNLTASRVSDDVMRKIRIFEKDAYLSTDYASQKIQFYQKRNQRIECTHLDIPKKEPLAEEISSFLRCIREKTQPVVRGHDARDALKIAITITRHMKKRQALFGT
ncbi:MAG: Gfo/Idh/MocA family oxidoreductase [Candidatus Omnitrophica bacterium]|nr:Gfo/Idh/MocA family oxidoreductase [Candidatus Omnitrophota bacterium]